MDRGGRARSPIRRSRSAEGWPLFIEPRRPASAAKTDDQPAVEDCLTSPATPGPSSTPRSGSCRWHVSPETGRRCQIAPCNTSKRWRAWLLELGGEPEPPARLHGDLWAGNRLVGSDGRNWLIDPAAHAGHREFDLAMMGLFGGFGPECFAAYEEAFPLGAGWRDRVALHQLAPLVGHAIKFGGSYPAAVDAALARYV